MQVGRTVMASFPCRKPRSQQRGLLWQLGLMLPTLPSPKCPTQILEDPYVSVLIIKVITVLHIVIILPHRMVVAVTSISRNMIPITTIHLLETRDSIPQASPHFYSCLFN